MTNQTLLGWIYQNKDKKSEIEMRDELLGQGWRLEEISQALDVAFSRKTEAPTPPVMYQPAPKKKRHRWVWGCLVFIVVVIAGVVIFAISVVKNIEKTEESVLKVAEKEIIEKGETKQVTLGSEKYSIEETIVLTNEGPGNASQVALWVALIQDLDPYQKVISWNITPEDYEIEFDEGKNKFAKFEFKKLALGEKLEIKISYQAEANKIKSYLGKCEGETISSYQDSETYIESDAPEIKNLASQLTQGKENDCQKVKALYDYVGDNIDYRGYVPEDRGAVATLETKDGDCTDFTDLFVALCRASGISSRPIEGATYKSEVSQLEDIKHSWAEVYLPGIGWAHFDPTWGRHESARQDHFAQTDGKHIVVSQGRKLMDREGVHSFFYDWKYDTARPAKITYQEDWQILPLD